MLKKLWLLTLCMLAVHNNTRAMKHILMKYVGLGAASYLIANPFCKQFTYSVEDARAELETHPEALHEACKNHDLKKVQRLLEAGASVIAQDNNGRMPLHYSAAQRPSWFFNKSVKRIAETLIACGAPLDAQDKDGETPLWHASFYDNESVMHVLVEHGAMLDIQDNEGWTPLHLVVVSDTKKFLELLVSKSFFHPDSTLPLSKGEASLQERCLYTLLNNINNFDENSLKSVIIPGIAHHLVIHPARNNLLEILTHQAPFNLQQKIVHIWKKNKSVENNNKIKLFLEAHLERHLARIKNLLMMRAHDGETVGDIGRTYQTQDVVALLDEVTNAKKFSDLKPTMQQMIKTTIENKLTR